MKWSKCHKNELKSEVYPSGKHEIFFLFTEFSPWPETHFKPRSSSRRGKLMVCGLYHSGSQPFKYKIVSSVYTLIILCMCVCVSRCVYNMSICAYSTCTSIMYKVPSLLSH